MAVLNVNPTRMELTTLKKKLAVARKGHKLLKDKRDEMMRQFLDIVRENRALRLEVEGELATAEKSIMMAKAVMGRSDLTAALMLPKNRIRLETDEKNIMSVAIPRFRLSEPLGQNILSYGFANTSGELDEGLKRLGSVFPKLIRLAEQEHAVQLLASEIEKTRRRVNALEHVMIPNYMDTIRYITMKLDENERSNITRLMKVKDMMMEEAIKDQKAEDARAAMVFGATGEGAAEV